MRRGEQVAVGVRFHPGSQRYGDHDDQRTGCGDCGSDGVARKTGG